MITEPADEVMVKLLLLADVVVLITGDATLGSKTMPSVVPLTTNFLLGDVVPMPTLPSVFLTTNHVLPPYLTPT